MAEYAYQKYTPKIYNGSSWGNYSPYIWNGSAWVEHPTYIYGVKTDTVLYDSGNAYTDATGGWNTPMLGGKVTFNSDHIAFDVEHNGVEVDGATLYYGAILTKNRIDLSPYSKLYASIYSDYKSGETIPQTSSVCVSDNTGTYSHTRIAQAGVPNGSSGSMTLSLDITNINGEYYIGYQWNARSGKIYKIWLE